MSRASTADRARRAARVGGELLITLGVVMLLFCVYQLVWTNVEAERAQDQAVDELEQRWHDPLPVARDQGESPAVPAPPAASEVVEAGDEGEPWALLHVPRLGDGWSVPVIEGVDADELARGVGHYPRTAVPGEVGNVAIAGHRSTNGEPFKDLDTLVRGDQIVVETAATWWVYEMHDSEIVAPTASDVLLPVPRQPEATPTEQLLTLTTCHPRWSSEQRLIVYAHLVEQRPKSDGPPAGVEG